MRTSRVPLFDKPNKQYVAKSASYAIFFLSSNNILFLPALFLQANNSFVIRIAKLYALFTIESH